MRRAAVALVASLLGCGAAPAGAVTSRVFAPVPSPGQPEGVAVETDGTVYAGTDTAPFGARPDGTPPSKLFAFNPDGTPKSEWTIQGETPDGTTSYGLFGLALDRAGTVYAVEHNPPSVVAIDPRTGAQSVYARFHDVPSCRPANRVTDCSITSGDLPAFPYFPVFAPDGTMYVTDIQQALIWRVRSGGGQGEVWFTDPRLEAPSGPHGAQFKRDGRTLMFATSAAPTGGGSPGLFTIAVRPDGRSGPLQQFWADTDGAAADGFQIALSGDVWVVASGHGQLLVLDPQGQEIQRVPTGGDSQEMPFDDAANVALYNGHAYVTNHAWRAFNPSHWAVLDVTPAEEGLPYFRPNATRRQRPTSPGIAPPLRIVLTVSPRRLVAGRRVRLGLRTRVFLGGRLRPLPGVLVSFAGRRARTGPTGRGRLTVRPRRLGPRSARATLRGYRAGGATVRVLRRRAR